MAERARARPRLISCCAEFKFSAEIPVQPPNPDEEQHPPAICTERFNVAGIYGDNPSRFAVIAGKPPCTGPAGKNPYLPLGTSLSHVQESGYSPAFDCPKGYQTALTVRHDGYFQFSKRLDVAPSSMAAFTSAFPISHVLTLMLNPTAYDTVSSPPTVNFIGLDVYIHWQSSDLALFVIWYRHKFNPEETRTLRVTSKGNFNLRD